MKMLAKVPFVLMLVASAFCSENDSGSDHSGGAVSSCPVWSKPGTNCSCGSEVTHKVSCTSEKLQIQAGYCMYYDEELNATFLGRCLHTAMHESYATHYEVNRSENGTKFNQDMCLHNPIAGNMHRQGRLCGECVEGYGLAAYSYYFIHCTNCSSYGYRNWIEYFAKAYLPLTVFYFIVIVFRINATAPPLNTLVLFSQLITLPSFMRLTAGFLENYKHNWPSIKAFCSFISIWNLDFANLFYKPTCLHPSFSILHIMALDYLVAVYPLLLIVLTYVLIELHDRNYRILVWMWKPFKMCFDRVHRDWQLRSSLVDGFATFLTLSYVKFCSISLDLLFPTTLYDVNGRTANRYYLFYDATVEIFSKKHLPFAILAIVVIIFLVVLPLALLCLYPCQCFQRLLNRLNIRSNWLHIFMDSFLGHYRFTPVDCRYFAGLQLLLRILVILDYEFTSEVFFATIVGILLLLTATLVVLLQPYKNRSSNKIDFIIYQIALYSVISGQGIIIASYVDPLYLTLAQYICYVAPVLVVLCFIILLLMRLLKNGTLSRRILTRIFNTIRGKLSFFNTQQAHVYEDREDEALFTQRDELPNYATPGEIT